MPIHITDNARIACSQIATAAKVAAHIVAAELRNIAQPILLGADAYADPDLAGAVARLVEIADLLDTRSTS